MEAKRPAEVTLATRNRSETVDRHGRACSCQRDVVLGGWMQIWQTRVGLWSINRTNMEAETWQYWCVRALEQVLHVQSAHFTVHTVNIDTISPRFSRGFYFEMTLQTEFYGETTAQSAHKLAQT